MTTVASTASSTPAGTTALGGATSGLETPDGAAERFLTLLVTQLRNQDPLNPLDNAQITSQLAQLSTVSGINKLNDTLSSLSASMDAREYLQSASLVGRTVITTGNKVTLADGKATGAFELASSADSVTVAIADAAGKELRRIELGAAPSGVTSFSWDGLDGTGAAVKGGTYTISVTASSGGKSVAATPLAAGVVTGLVPGAGGGSLNVGGIGRVGLDSVRQIS